MNVKVMKYNIYNGAFDSEYQSGLITTALTVSGILTFQICDLEHLGQGHGVQHSQWSHSNANIYFYKSNI